MHAQGATCGGNEYTTLEDTINTYLVKEINKNKLSKNNNSDNKFAEIKRKSAKMSKETR